MFFFFLVVAVVLLLLLFSFSIEPWTLESQNGFLSFFQDAPGHPRGMSQERSRHTSDLLSDAPFASGICLGLGEEAALMAPALHLLRGPQGVRGKGLANDTAGKSPSMLQGLSH